jgi:DNA-binding HxlR family transcriptional regulator
MDTKQESKVASSIFIGRWTPKVLFSLEERPYRHGQLRRRLGSVSQRMLTRTLGNLESAGLIAPRVSQSKAIAAEYSLTRLGRTIIAPLGGMCGQAKRYRKNVSAYCDFGKPRWGGLASHFRQVLEEGRAQQCMRYAPVTANESEVQRRDICAQHASKAQQ